MPDSSALLLFMTAALVLLLTPGPAVLYIVARGVDQGRLAAFVSTLGLASGTVFHVAAAAFGFSALLMSSVLAFNVVKYAGAAYLIYLGIRKLITKTPLPEDIEHAPKQPFRDIYLQGIVVSLLNPKTALFFFAFLPQFVDVSRGSVALQIGFLGGVFIFMSLFTDGLYGFAAGSLGGWLKRNRNFLRAERFFSGTVYIGLGLATAFSGAHKK